MKPVRILLAHHDESSRNILRALLENLDHEVIEEVSDRKGIMDEGLRLKPQLVITCFQYDDGNAVDTLLSLSETRPTPTIIIAEKKNLGNVEKAMEDHVMAYLVDPVTIDDLGPTILVVIRRFQEMQDLKDEVGDLKEQLATRKKVERAKGILMANHKLSEEEAYLRLRKSATKQQRKMSEVADLIIDMATDAS